MVRAPKGSSLISKGGKPYQGRQQCTRNKRGKPVFATAWQFVTEEDAKPPASCTSVALHVCVACYGVNMPGFCFTRAGKVSGRNKGRKETQQLCSAEDGSPERKCCLTAFYTPASTGKTPASLPPSWTPQTVGPFGGLPQGIHLVPAPSLWIPCHQLVLQ